MPLPAILAIKFPELAANWSDCAAYFHPQTVPAHTTLLAQGDVADTIYLVVHGALHLLHETDQKTIAVQFFLENQIVSSFESFYCQMPSDYDIMHFGKERCSMGVMKKKYLSIRLQW